MGEFFLRVAAVVAGILVICLVINGIFLGMGFLAEIETKILPNIPGVVPNEISVTKIMSFFPIRYIRYHWNSNNKQEEVKKTDFMNISVLLGVTYDPEVGNIVQIEGKKQFLNYSSETKAWTVKTKESGYESVIPSDNQFLKDSIAEAEELLTYARKRFRKILIRAGALGAEETKTE